MTELIVPVSGSKIRWRLLVTASALALISFECSAADTNRDDAEHPTVWIELGGQLERIDGTGDRNILPFMTVSPTPPPFGPVSPVDAERAPRYAFGEEGKISFQPRGTNWVFSAAVRYGRSNGNKTVKHQTDRVRHETFSAYYTYPLTKSVAQFAKTSAKHRESHTVVDFMAGKDVGLGMFGRSTESVVSIGVRYAQFQTKENIKMYARPNIEAYNAWPFATSGGIPYVPGAIFNQYTLFANNSRSFHGIGPAISWDASVPIAGSSDDASVTFDWGVNAALLFGRQKADISHQTTASHYHGGLFAGYHYTNLYRHSVAHSRSRSIAVPNVGGFAGISLKFSNAKVSLGYRGDLYFGAVDVGIDTRTTKKLDFHGPFATISIGVGG